MRLGEKSRRPAVMGGLFVLALAGMAAVRHNRPVLMKLGFDDTLRPRLHCIMNPFRERGPERVCEWYLAELRSGRVDSLRPLVRQDSVDHIMSRESQYRIVSWRIGDRKDKSTGSDLMYWVRRAGGYPPGEEEVMFVLSSHGDRWECADFSAIY